MYSKVIQLYINIHTQIYSDSFSLKVIIEYWAESSVLTVAPCWLSILYMLCYAKVTSAVSDSVRPHRQHPTRLPHPWDSPGKNTCVGCHFLLQCMKVKSESEVSQSCPTLSDPVDWSLSGSSIHGIFQARVLEWGAIVTIFDKLKNLESIVQTLLFLIWQNTEAWTSRL